jgi:CheY-like chemotaxis protein
MRIALLVDASPDQRKLYTDGLRRYHSSFEVLTAGSVPEATDILGHLAVDLLVTDFSAELDGFSLLLHLHAAHSSIPAIALAGAPGTPAPTGSSLTVLAKPVGHEALASRILAALERGGGVGLPELLHAAALQGCTCALSVTSGDRRATLRLEDGHLADAVIHGGPTGEAALAAVLSWPEARAALAADLPQSGEQPRPERAAAQSATQGPSSTKEMVMADLREDLDTEAQALLEVLKRLQARTQEADAALSAVMADFGAFREQRAKLQASEARFAERQRRLEQRLLGAEQLAQQLLSVVKQAETDEDAARSDSLEADAAIRAP